MQKKELAIASVPMQKWGALYDGEKALQTGTIFEDLDMPFFAADEGNISRIRMPKSPKEQECADMMKKIAETDFILQDLTLYLDTHEGEKDALQMFREKAQEKAEVVRQFTQKCYPLTRDCLAQCSGGEQFCWLEGPIPWEGACV